MLISVFRLAHLCNITTACFAHTIHFLHTNTPPTNTSFTSQNMLHVNGIFPVLESDLILRYDSIVAGFAGFYREKCLDDMVVERMGEGKNVLSIFDKYYM